MRAEGVGFSGRGEGEGGGTVVCGGPSPSPSLIAPSRPPPPVPLTHLLNDVIDGAHRGIVCHGVGNANAHAVLKTYDKGGHQSVWIRCGSVWIRCGSGVDQCGPGVEQVCRQAGDANAHAVLQTEEDKGGEQSGRLQQIESGPIEGSSQSARQNIGIRQACMQASAD